MAHPYQIGDVVHVRKHTDEEKMDYPFDWYTYMDQFEDVNCVITRVRMHLNGSISYQLHLMQSPNPIRPGQSRGDIVTHEDYALFAADSISMVTPGPFRNIVVNGIPMPYLGDTLPYDTDPVDDILWGTVTVRVCGVEFCSTKIPEPAFTTF